jgi:hypothetical protein
MYMHLLVILLIMNHHCMVKNNLKLVLLYFMTLIISQFIKTDLIVG